VAVTAQLPELGNVRIRGQIDRLAVTARCPDRRLKTNARRPTPTESTPRALSHADGALSRRACKNVYPASRSDCALVWTGRRPADAPFRALLDVEMRPDRGRREVQIAPRN